MATRLGDFTLDTSTLGGGQFATVPFAMGGAFREIQFALTDSVLGQDFEPHFFEFHFTVVGVVEHTGP